MPTARLLPDYLVRRYHGWKATTYQDNKGWYQHLAEDGQHPRCMVISCCDSRVQITSLFGADQGEFFIHRNIANLVPPHNPDGHHHGTSAAVEYAVTALKINQLIVMGHSNCGGIRGCYDMCSGNAPDLERKESFIGRWMDILRPSFEELPKGDDAERVRLLEQNSVVTSMRNLMTFPHVMEAMDSGRLSLHGLWHDLASGSLMQFHPDSRTFTVV